MAQRRWLHHSNTPLLPVAEHDVEAASGKNFRKLQRSVAERLTEGERPSAAMKPCVNGPAAEVVGEPGGGDDNRIGRQRLEEGCSPEVARLVRDTLRKNAEIERTHERVAAADAVVEKGEGFAGLASTSLVCSPVASKSTRPKPDCRPVNFFIQMAGRLACPKTPYATELRHRCARPGYRSIPAARFVTIEKRPTATRKCRLTVGTACPPVQRLSGLTRFTVTPKDFAPARYWRDQSSVIVLRTASG